MLIILFFTAFINKANGFPQIKLSSSLFQNINIEKEGWKKITTWSTPASTGHASSELPVDNFKDGIFKAPISGIYSVYSTVTLSGSQDGSYKLAVWINDLENNIHPGLQSSFQNSPGFRSLSISGTVRLQIGDSISTYVHSVTDEKWIIIGKSESTFCVEFNGFYGYIPGFSAHLGSNQTFKNNEWNQPVNWNPSESKGLYKSQTGFSNGAGFFYSITSGIYQFSANVLFSVHEKGTFQVGFALNDNTTGSTMSLYEERINATFTLSISVSLYLEKGDKVTLWTKGDVHYTILVDTGFSAILINRGSQKIGFSTVFNSSVKGNGMTWVNIPLPPPGSNHGQFNENENNIIGGRFIHPYTRFFIITANVHIKATSPKGLALSLVSDGARLLASSSGILHQRTGIPSAKVQSYGLAGILELPADQPLFLYIHLSNQEDFEILPGTRISATATQPDYPAFSVVINKQLSFSEAGVWLKLETWKETKDGSFLYANVLTGGKFTAPSTGIYFFTTNVIFHDANGPISVLISLNDVTSKRKSLFATKGNPSTVEETVSLSGPLYIQKGSTASVYVSVEDDYNWFVGVDSSFSCTYLGTHHSFPGISTVLKNKIVVNNQGWNKLTNWEEQILTESYFMSGAGFDAVNGDYTAPKDGLYLVSANVKLQSASEKNSEFTLTVAVNSDPNTFTDQNGIQDYIQCNTGPPLANDYYSLTITGVIKANKNEKISLYLEGKGDALYSMSQDSSFAVVYLSPLDDYYTQGMQIMLQPAISQAVDKATTWHILRYWTHQRPATTAPILFSQGSVLELDSNDGTILIKENGIYFVSINIGINNGNDNFELALQTSSGITVVNTKYGKTSPTASETRSTYTLKGFGIVFLAKNQRVSARIRSDAGEKSWENLRSVTGWSIARIPVLTLMPSIVAGVPKNQTLQTSSGLWSRILHWQTDNAPYLTRSTDSFKDGYFETVVSGLYLIGVTVNINKTLNNQFIRLKIGLNGDDSIPGSKIIDSGHGPTFLITECNNYCAYSLTETLILNAGDKVSAYLQTTDNEISIKSPSNFQVQFLSSLTPLPQGFSMQLQNTKQFNSFGTVKLGGFTEIRFQGRYFDMSGQDRDSFKVTKPGIYVTLVSVEVIKFTGLIRLDAILSNDVTVSSLRKDSSEQSFSLSLYGLILANKDEEYSLNIYSDQDNDFTISEGSLSVLTYIGEADNQNGFIARLANQMAVSSKANTFTEIKNWAVHKATQKWTFDAGDGLTNNHYFLTKISGTYFIGANLVVSQSSENMIETEAVVFLNGVLQTNVFSRIFVPQQGTRTLNVAGNMVLNKWDSLEIKMKVNSSEVVNIQTESTFYALRIDQTPIPETFNDPGPNIITNLTPDIQRLEIGAATKWDCQGFGENPSYGWEKDFKSIPFATSQTLQLSNITSSDSGKYMCIMNADGIKTSSNVIRVYAFDPSPIFLNSTENFYVITPENGPQDLEILRIIAKAESFEDGNTDILFSLKGNAGDTFMITPTKSKYGTSLIRKKALDRENNSLYHFQIIAKSVIRPNSTRYRNITVTVVDENDNAPVFEEKDYRISVLENVVIGSTVIRVKAEDKDIGENANVTYSILPGPALEYFEINPKNGSVKVIKKLDREKESSFVIYLTASDGRFISYKVLTIRISDVNDHVPYFSRDQYSVNVQETIKPGIPILTIVAIDKDSGNNSKLQYSIEDGNKGNLFMINELGAIFTTDFLTNVNESFFSLVIAVKDNGNPSLANPNTAIVKLTIKRANDKLPTFSQPEYSVTIPENSPDEIIHILAKDYQGNTYVAPTVPTDLFMAGPGSISYSIPSLQNVSSTFSIMSSVTGQISLLKALDYEQQRTYQFSVEAIDAEIPPNKATASVLVRVTDENDNKPVFVNNSATAMIMESANVDRFVYQVMAYDKDDKLNGQVHYEIEGGNIGNTFSINNLGVIITKKPLDREERNQYTLTISAYDLGDPPKKAALSFILNVVVGDKNDNAPKFDKPQYQVTVNETVVLNSRILIFTIIDEDEGKNSRIDVSIKSNANSNIFSIEKQSPIEYSLKLNQALDYEIQKIYHLTINAKDNGATSLERTVSVNILVRNMNDNQPNFESNSGLVALTQILTQEKFVYQAQASDPDMGPAGKLIYKITNGNKDEAFKIESDTGKILTNNVKSLSSNFEYQLTIIAEDSFVPPRQSNPFLLKVITSAQLQARETVIGKNQLRTVLLLTPFAYLTEVKTMQVLVQRNRPEDPEFNNATVQSPLYWHHVFTNNAHRLRRYIALEISFPLTSNTRLSKRSVNSDLPESISVTIGNEGGCNTATNKVCNGPLASGESYRLQLQIYEINKPEPVQSHFSHVLTIPPESQALLSESGRSDGILLMGVAFGLIVLTAVVAMLIYVCWKQTHEIVHVDHLREKRDFTSNNLFDPMADEYLTPPNGEIDIRKFSLDDSSLWSQIDESEQLSSSSIINDTLRELDIITEAVEPPRMSPQPTVAQAHENQGYTENDPIQPIKPLKAENPRVNALKKSFSFRFKRFKKYEGRKEAMIEKSKEAPSAEDPYNISLSELEIPIDEPDKKEPIYESADDVINKIQENTNASRKYSSMSMDLSINSGSDSESKNQFYGENKNVYKLSDDENAILL